MKDMFTYKTIPNLSYWSLFSGSDKTSYASLISFVISVEFTDPEFLSGWYFVICLLYASLIS